MFLGSAVWTIFYGRIDVPGSAHFQRNHGQVVALELVFEGGEGEVKRQDADQPYPTVSGYIVSDKQ